jgi:hypothetical protein
MLSLCFARALCCSWVFSPISYAHLGNLGVLSHHLYASSFRQFWLPALPLLAVLSCRRALLPVMGVTAAGGTTAPEGRAALQTALPSLYRLVTAHSLRTFLLLLLMLKLPEP